VADHEVLVAGLILLAPDDRHVLAAAIGCNPNVLGTFNGKETNGSGIYKMTNKRKNRALVDHLKGFTS
jgi:hypothetical protein